MSLQRRLIVDMYRTVRELAGGAFQAMPSSEASFLSPDTGADAERYYQSSTTGAHYRIKILKLIWDLIGTEYGGRQLQYEMFYSAAQPAVNRRVFGAYDWASAGALVDRLLAEY
jgi:4-hydroxyphenylacetate 3-monooxygenase